MVKTIGNPFTWIAGAIAGTGRGVGAVAESLGSEVTEPPRTRHITRADVRAALKRGYADFTKFRSDVLFLVAIYPVIGIVLAFMAFDQALVPMIFPLAAGFCLLGPVAAVGLYEMSRQHESSEDVSWGSALSSLRARNVGPVVVLGLYLLGIFILWMFAAYMIYSWTLGPAAPDSAVTFLNDVFATPAGWAMILLGIGVGAVFAAIVLVISLVSFPMLIDRNAGVPVAVATSLKVARQSPTAVAMWGFMVAGLMVIGSAPLFIGLMIILPWLGHATWHLYRAAVPREEGAGARQEDRV
jgi:uncharacterized membrane protein